MPSTRSHEFFARHSPFKLWYLATVALLIIALFRYAQFSLHSIITWWGILGLLALVPAAVILGGIVGIFSYLLFCFCIFDIEKFVVRRNGGPFKVGDTVTVLCGPHQGKSGTIYDTPTDQGGTPNANVRVDLGEAAKADFSDFFEHRQVMRN